MKLVSILLVTLFSFSVFARHSDSVKITIVRANSQAELQSLVQQTVYAINSGTHRDSCDVSKVYAVEMLNSGYRVDHNGNMIPSRPAAAIKFRCRDNRNDD